MDIEKAIEGLRFQVEAEMRDLRQTKEIEELKVRYLGKKGPVQRLMENLKEAPPERRPEIGKLVNDFKNELNALFQTRLEKFAHQEQKSRFEEERIDITLPGRRRNLGRKHIALKMLDDVLDIFVGMGFAVQYGPDIESDYYNFEALNFAKDHPARDMQDTFYISSDLLLRTHTSNTQVRVMEKTKPPIRIVAPGRCYRNEDISARSYVVFHQVEGLYIDKGVTFADLLATLQIFFSKLFRKDLEMRFRPSYFPFVEPGVEVDVHCFLCDGKGCSICKKTGWLEVTGAGMVHPEVLKYGGIDPEVYTGYAWGFGTERLAMLRYGIPDIRLFWENHLSFLEQF